MDYYNYSAGQPMYNPWATQPQMMPYQMPMMNQPVQQPMQSDNRFTWIQGGRETAQAYPTAPNKTILFINDTKDHAFFKKTDSEGKTTLFESYKLVKEEDDVRSVSPESMYVSKDDFKVYADNINKTLVDVMNKLDNLGGYNNQPQQPRYNGKNYKGKGNYNG